MTLALYFDHHVQKRIAIELRRWGIDVLTAEQDRAAQHADVDLLARATELGRVFVSNDDDLLAITARWRGEGRHFAGLVYLTRQRLPYGKVIEGLNLIAEAYSVDEMLDRIEYLPL